jgi:phosphoglycerate dehydrogenase-like enzyme
MGKILKVAVLDDYQSAAMKYGNWDRIASRAEVTVFSNNLADTDALAERLAPFDVVCLMRERTRMSEAVLSRLPNLKLIVTTGMRNAALDFDAAIARGILICGTGAIQTGTPELTWLHILALARNFAMEQRAIESGAWQAGVGKDLNQSTLGIIGLGRVGIHVARVAQAFGMRVLAWSPNLTPERARAGGAEYVGKQDLFRTADFVTLSLQLSARTRGVVGAAEFALMKPGAYFINTSRAPLVDEAALIDALRSGRIAGAGIDVYESEPLSRDHPLRGMNNVVLTPHIGYVTEATYAQFHAETVEDIAAWLDGKAIRVLQPER